ncbi:MAG: hypothetical protein WEF99_05455 [Thermoanaerobaculia bacterium]
MSLHFGTRLGSFSIVSAIAAGGMGEIAGGMGEIIRARDDRLERGMLMLMGMHIKGYS